MTLVRSALVAISLTLLGPATASAAETIGSSLPAWTDDTLECLHPGGCTFVSTSIAGDEVVVPHDGVIVRWTGRAPAGSASTIRLRVLHPVAGGQFLAGPSAGATLNPDGTLAGGGHLAVEAGDRIAIELDDGGEIGIVEHTSFDSTSSTFAPRLQEGETRPPDSTDGDDFEALFNATIEPDADGDLLGDETQDLCTAASGLRCSRTDTKLDLFPRPSHASLTQGDAVVLAEQQLTLRASVHALLGRLPNAVLTLNLPPELAGAGASAPGPCTVSASQIVCQLGTLQENRAAEVVARVRGVRAGGAVRWSSLDVPVARVQASVTSAAGGTPESKHTYVRVLSTEPCGNPAKTSRLPDPGTLAGDSLTGTASADTFDGLAGDDCMFGKGAGDTLGGGTGDDRLEGAFGDDRLRGQSGNDRLVGGLGKDLLEGGSGKDSIEAVDRARDVVRCGPGRDRARVDAVDSVKGCERVTRVPARRRR